MGYESRLYVVEKSRCSKELIDKKEMNWGEVVAVFNLCVVPDVSYRMRDYKPTDCFIYDNNEKLLEDKYGESLKEIPLADAIQILEEAAKEEGYRRWNPCIQMLKGFNSNEWNNLVVLHYGY